MKPKTHSKHIITYYMLTCPNNFKRHSKESKQEHSSPRILHSSNYNHTNQHEANFQGQLNNNMRLNNNILTTVLALSMNSKQMKPQMLRQIMQIHEQINTHPFHFGCR